MRTSRLGALVAGLLLLAGCASPRDDARPWMDLVAEDRYAEAFYAPEYRLDGSRPGDVGYLDERWQGASPGGKGLLSAGATAAFRLPLLPMPASGLLVIEPDWPGPAGPRDVTLRMNGAPFRTFPAPGPTRRRFDVPRELVRAGTNDLEIDCPGARSFRVVRLVVRAEPKEATGADLARGSWVGSVAGRPAVLQLPGARLSYYVRAPPRASLRFRLPPVTGRAAFYTVRMQRAGRAARSVFAGASGSGEVDVPLIGPGEEPLRIDFEVAAGTAHRAEAAFPWEAPRIVRERGERPPATARNDPRPGKRPNVVLYVIDALRADHLQAYGYPRPTSPEIARFARDALVFDHAYAHSVWTKPCVGSLLSGRLPSRHLAVNDVAHLSESVRLLPSYLREAGYTSVGLQHNGNAGAYFGFARGFDLFFPTRRRRPPPPPAPAPDPPLDRGSRSSERAVQSLVRLAGRLKEPFFLFVQTIDPHDPYDPPEGFRDLAAGRTIPGLSPRDALQRFLTLPSDRLQSPEALRLRRHLEALYDCEIRHNDHFFGQTLELLRHRGLLDNTVVILTADHGEAFREHGYDGYHSTFYENTIRVPLIVRLPWSASGRHVTTPVQHLDVVPTVLELAGLTAAGLPGRSLLAADEASAQTEPRTIHAMRYRDLEIPRFTTEGRAVVSWPWKLIQNDVWSPRVELYDLEADPGERTNLWSGADSVLRSFLRVEARRVPLRLHEVYTGHAGLTPEAEEALRALGYIQ